MTRAILYYILHANPQQFCVVDHTRQTAGLLGSIHRTFKKSSRVLNDDNSGNMHDRIFQDPKEISVQNKPTCSRCGPISSLPNASCPEECSDDGDTNEKALAIVPIQTKTTTTTITTLSVREPPELKPGWPLLQRTILSDTSSVREISVVQWAMQLPCRTLSFDTDHDHKQYTCDQSQDQSISLDSESGAIVPVDAIIRKASTSPERNSIDMLKELEVLHEKYSSTCRLFEYHELVLATSNFSPGLF